MDFEPIGAENNHFFVSKDGGHKLKKFLKPGQIVQGVVKENLGGNRYLVQINGIQTIGYTEIRMEKGQMFYASVRNNLEKIILSFIKKSEEGIFLKKDLIQRIELILSKLNLKADDLSVKTALEFVRNGMSLENNFKNFVGFLRENGIVSNEGVAGAVFLYKNLFPINKSAAEKIGDLIFENDISFSKNDGVLFAKLFDFLKENFSAKELESNFGREIIGFINDVALKDNMSKAEIFNLIQNVFQNSGLYFENKLKSIFSEFLLKNNDLNEFVKDFGEYFLKNYENIKNALKESGLSNYKDLWQAYLNLKEVIKKIIAKMKNGGSGINDFAVKKRLFYDFFDSSAKFLSELKKFMDVSQKSKSDLPDEIVDFSARLYRNTGSVIKDKSLQEFLNLMFGSSKVIKGKFDSKSINTLVRDFKLILYKILNVLADEKLNVLKENKEKFVKAILSNLVKEQIKFGNSDVDLKEIVFSLPFFENSKQNEVKIYFRKEKEKKIKSYSNRYLVVIFLELSKIGQIRADVNYAGGNVECCFYSPRDDVVKLINDNLNELGRELEVIGFRPILRAEVKKRLFEKRNLQKDVISKNVFYKIDFTV